MEGNDRLKLGVDDMHHIGITAASNTVPLRGKQQPEFSTIQSAAPEINNKVASLRRQAIGSPEIWC